MFSSNLLLRLALLGPLAWYVFSILDAALPGAYIFSPAKLQEISQAAIAQHSADGSSSNNSSTEALLQAITSVLQAEYGAGAVSSWTSADWFFNNAGGAMGSMVILHASLTEYLIFFGTALQTEGHTGIHAADDYFTILTGTQLAYAPGAFEPEVYGPGSQHHLRRGHGKQYAMPGPCFALELAQGWIPAMLPFGFADTFSSTLDWGNLWRTCKFTALGMGTQLMRGKI